MPSKFSEFRTHAQRSCTHTYLLSLPWRDGEEHWNLSEDSSSLCSIIHHLWLQNSLGSPRGYALYPDRTPRRATVSLFTLRPRGPLEYTTAMLTSEPSKINQNQPGASHLLNSCSLALFLNQKTSFSPPSFCENGSFSQTSAGDILANVRETLPSIPHRPFVLLLSMNLYIFTHYHTIRSSLRIFICTSINSYLKD